MHNIAFSTTCQWNPGDEFILHGIRNCLNAAGIKYNSILYNRNPIVNPKSGSRNTRAFHENSLVHNGTFAADYAIVAGTPEWARGPRADRFLEYIQKHQLRCSFLGVGRARALRPSRLLQAVLRENTDVFLGRDEATTDSVSSYFPDATLAPCPSIFAAKNFRTRSKVQRVACVLQGTRIRGQRIRPTIQIRLYEQYRKIAQRFAVEYVAHFIDDFTDASPTNAPIYYSGIAADYYEIYDRFDLVVASRLHACGIATSLGIPSICLGHDGRAAAAPRMGAVLVMRPEEVLLAIESHDWHAVAHKLKTIRRSAASIYTKSIAAMRFLEF